MWRNPKKRKKRDFEGNKFEIIDSLPKLPDSLLLVGDLEELECETPLEPKVDAMKLFKDKSSKGAPLVCASGDGRFGIILPADRITGKVSGSPNAKDIKDAIDLHLEFHGTEHDEIKKVHTEPVNKLVFLGWLNYIVYDVPQYSERRGVPFIHEAKDKGDDEPPAKDKPIVCISPSKDMIIMYGKEFSFTDRGFIG